MNLQAPSLYNQALFLLYYFQLQFWCRGVTGEQNRGGAREKSDWRGRARSPEGGHVTIPCTTVRHLRKLIRPPSVLLKPRLNSKVRETVIKSLIRLSRIFKFEFLNFHVSQFWKHSQGLKCSGCLNITAEFDQTVWFSVNSVQNQLLHFMLRTQQF